jgi:hypothetical protein
MARQAIRSIPKYPFKMSDTETISGTTNNATVTTIGEFVLHNFSEMFGQNSALNEIPLYFMTLDHIDVDGETLRFMEPITANVLYQDKVYFCRNEDLGVVSLSDKLEDCVKDFKDEVLFIWKEYGKEDDNKLTNDAKELKRKILRYIGK